MLAMVMEAISAGKRRARERFRITEGWKGVNFALLVSPSIFEGV
jgi:hypothetical protein